MRITSLTAALAAALGIAVAVATAPAAFAQPPRKGDAAAAPKGKAAAPARATGKLTAPVAIDAELTESAARVTVRFEAAAAAVRIEIYGVDGLVVKGEAAVIRDGAFAKGDTRTFDVTFARGAGRSHLVVAVAGRFGGARSNRVATFAIGTATEQQMKGPATKMTTGGGPPIKVLPAKRP